MMEETLLQLDILTHQVKPPELGIIYGVISPLKPQNITFIAKAIVCSLQSDGKILLLKTILTYFIEHEKFD